MLFPKGQPLHENLNTSFTQFDAMLAELKNNLFTGYVRITAWEYEGILILDTGRVVHAIDESKGTRRIGPAAAETVAARAREKDGTISVYRLPEENVQVLSGLYNGEPVYKDLTSDFTSLDKLIEKLRGERHSGYIEIQMTKSQDAATIFGRDGQIIDCIFLNNGDVTSGTKILPQIIEATGKGAMFTVYRINLEQAYTQGSDLADSFVRQDTFALWQDFMNRMEAIVSKTKSGNFTTAFKRVCIAKANQYPFLDPFAAEFEFKDGQIRFDSSASLAQLNQGLSDCVAQAIRDLTADPTHKNLLSSLQNEAALLFGQYGKRIEEIGLADAAHEIFGN
jgi:hypothetical protein